MRVTFSVSCSIEEHILWLY